MGPPSYMRSVVDRNFVMRRMTVQEKKAVPNGDRDTSVTHSNDKALN